MKWFTGLDGELKNPSCDVSAVPDEISYGAQDQPPDDLASCDAPSAFDGAATRRQARRQRVARARWRTRVDGRAGPSPAPSRTRFRWRRGAKARPGMCHRRVYRDARLRYDI